MKMISSMITRQETSNTGRREEGQGKGHEQQEQEQQQQQRLQQRRYVQCSCLVVVIVLLSLAESGTSFQLSSTNRRRFDCPVRKSYHHHQCQQVQSNDRWRYPHYQQLNGETRKSQRSNRSTSSCRSTSSLSLTGSNSSQEEIDRQLEKARAVLATSRAKIEAAVAIEDDVHTDNNDDEELDKQRQQRNGALASNVPFFATTSSSSTNTNNKKKKQQVIKDQNEETGLFTTDGDLMAKLSEEEEWEPRPLLEVFTNERKTSSSDKDPLATRDVAASIWNLRKSLQTEDYQKIFDKRNRFIGDQ